MTKPNIADLAANGEKLCALVEGFLDVDGDSPLQVFFGTQKSDVAEAVAAFRTMLAQATQVPTQTVSPPDAMTVLAIANDAVDIMTRFQDHAQADDTPDMNAVFPAAEFRCFVDGHAQLLYRLARARAGVA